MTCPLTLVVIGGGAAGFFGAITAAEGNPDARVILLEKARQVLSKVRISGGGRCNVTHSCFDPSILVQHYPRGGKALRGPFSRFQPRDTVEWFERRGVVLKTESDGRMFPVTDSSETIIDCLTGAAKKAGVEVRIECGVGRIEKKDCGFVIELASGERLSCDRILMATGSAPKVFELVRELGHTVVPPVPSLFTFHIPKSPFLDLAGISVPQAHVKILGTSLEQTGPLLITHWGFSGPAILKLSAWGARVLHDNNYTGLLGINWVPHLKEERVWEMLVDFKSINAARLVSGDSPFELPRNLWKKLVALAGIGSEQRWAVLSKVQMTSLVGMLQRSEHRMEGKSTYKEEFVTCGGVCLDEVNFKTMESRIVPGLYFAGEMLDIDGVTGGFNFQNAWTTSWLAGIAMSKG